MNILIVGSGGREHALAWKIAQSPHATHIYVAPGNAGTAWPAQNIDIAAGDIVGLCRFAQQNHVGLTVVGPEAPLADGIVDHFHKHGLRIFGPTRAAAQLEASKAFAKSFMNEIGIPTAAHATFRDKNEAVTYLAATAPDGNVVIKAGGLAAGKGVIVCDSLGAAQTAVKVIMEDRAFGTAGDQLIIEERLTGPELSLIAFSDGKTVAPLAPSRDHKRAYDGGQGPNTGGMGAFAPVPEITADDIDDIVKTVLQPAVDGMARRGTPYVGVLYAGLMLTPDGRRVLEFNCRFGDPETQVILPLLDGDLVEIMLACIRGELDPAQVRQRNGHQAAVVMASPGYPKSYPTGLPITGVENAAQQTDTQVFHAGTTRRDDGRLVTSGGRVLAISAWGSHMSNALEKAYAGVDQITFDNAHYRTDIGRGADTDAS